MQYTYDSRGSAVGFITGNYVHLMNGRARGTAKRQSRSQTFGLLHWELFRDMILDMGQGNPGRVRYANGIQPPAQTREHYGEIAKAKLDAPDQITVELRAYTAMCCSHPFTAKISDNGMTLSGAWPSGPNQAPRVAEWGEMQGNSCLAKSDFKMP
jgi:hypothetical protein